MTQPQTTENKEVNESIDSIHPYDGITIAVESLSVRAVCEVSEDESTNAGNPIQEEDILVAEITQGIPAYVEEEGVVLCNESIYASKENLKLRALILTIALVLALSILFFNRIKLVESNALIILREHLSSLDVSAIELLRDPSTPQYRAMDWIANHDKSTLTEDYFAMLKKREETRLTSESGTDNTYIQRYILVVLYFATNGQYWSKDTLFLSENHECNWRDVNDPLFTFIKCEDKTKRIEEIQLHSINASGTLPEEVGYLRDLKHFRMEGNSIGGSIPTTFSLLSELVMLDVGQNKLIGTLPNLTNYTKMKVLRLSLNQLAGGIPDGLSSMKEIEELNLKNNNLNGILPSSIGELEKLTSFNCGRNVLSGTIPVELYNAKLLRSMNLQGNRLSGRISEEIGKLVYLEEINLSDNELMGTIPGSIGNAEDLLSLKMAGNNLEGSLENLIISIENLLILRELDISDNQLSGTIPVAIAQLKNLQRLNLSGNNFYGEVPFSFSNLNKLYVLDLSRNNVTGNVTFLCAKEDYIPGIKFIVFAMDCKNIVICGCCTSCF